MFFRRFFEAAASAHVDISNGAEVARITAAMIPATAAFISKSPWLGTTLLTRQRHRSRTLAILCGFQSYGNFVPMDGPFHTCVVSCPRGSCGLAE